MRKFFQNDIFINLFMIILPAFLIVATIGISYSLGKDIITVYNQFGIQRVIMDLIVGLGVVCLIKMAFCFIDKKKGSK